MRMCSRCLYSSLHPLNLVFDNEGICSGCRVHEEKEILDWPERAKRLKAILNQYRCKSGRNYDCIVPVSGARDSYFIVHTIKNIYGMNPLLVNYNKQYNTPEGVRNLANLRVRFDCDIMTLTVNPEIVKKVTRGTLRRLGSIYWHCIAGQTVFPVQMAVKFKIPLIIWGAHQGIDQVGMFRHLDEVEMTRKYRKEHDLMGVEAEDLINDFDNIKESDVLAYAYPENRELEQVGVRGIYLNNYIRWDSRAQHEQMIKNYGYETNFQTRTFDNYNDVDCWYYSDLHDYIKWLKYGFGKVIDHSCREIRLGYMSRREGLEVSKFYLAREPRHLQLFLSWIGISENSFEYLMDQHRNPSVWRRNSKWEWEPVNNVYVQEPGAHEYTGSKPPRLSNEFLLTHKNHSSDRVDENILIGRGFPNI